MIDFAISSLLGIAVGVGLRACRHHPAAADLLRDVILKAALPATVLVALLRVDLEAAWLVLPVLMLAWSLFMLVVLALWLPSAEGAVSAEQARTLMVCLPTSAPALVAFPFIAAVLGDAGVAQATAGFLGCLAVFAIAPPFIVAVLAPDAGARPKPARVAASALGRLVREPVSASAGLGLLLAGGGVEIDDVPPALAGLLESLQQLLAPLVLLYVGLSCRIERRLVALVLTVLSLRLGWSLLFAAAVLACVPLGSIEPALVVVLPMGTPSLLALSATWAGYGARSRDRFDAAFGLATYAISLPYAMAAAGLTLAFASVMIDPVVLAGLGALQVALVGLVFADGRAGQRRRSPRAARHPVTSTARKSLTFVSVGPVTRRSPTAAKAEYASLAASAAAGSTPASRMRASVSGRRKAPALSSEPSMPSVSAASVAMPSVPSSASARPNRNSVLRPPLPPSPRTVTVVSPPERMTAGAATGSPERAA